MALRNLSQCDLDTLRRCLIAAAEGPFFDEAEFSTVFGISRDELRGVICRWPDVSESESVDRAAITNSLNNLLGYPHQLNTECEAMTGVPRKELLRLQQAWQSTVGPE